jgi:hypothetical protein
MSLVLLLSFDCKHRTYGPIVHVRVFLFLFPFFLNNFFVVDVFIGKRYQRRPKQAAHQE